MSSQRKFLKFLLVILALLVGLCAIQGCAPMPTSSKIFPQVEESISLEDIQDFKEVPQNLWATMATCYGIMFKRNPIKAALALSLGVPILGCCDIKVVDEKIVKCHAYYPSGDEYTREHELNHCRGYADKLF